MRIADKRALWVTSTHKRVAEINKKYLKELNAQGNKTVRIIAYHIPTNTKTNYPDYNERNKCYAVRGNSTTGSMKDPFPTHIDIAIGSRVRCTRNLNTEQGIYNGKMGTVYGFVFKNGPPIYNDNDELISHFAQYEDHQREIPIVLVQMDEDDYLIESCIKNAPRIVPFGPIVGDKKNYSWKIQPLYDTTTTSISKNC